MPRLFKEYNHKSNDPVGAFYGRTTDPEASATYQHPKKVPWLCCNPEHPLYSEIQRFDSTHKGLIWIVDEFQKWFYESLKDAVTKTNLTITSDDEEQSLTIFGIKIYPVLWSMWLYEGNLDSMWNDSSYFSQSGKMYPVIFKENDISLKYNSFIGNYCDSYSVTVTQGKWNYYNDREWKKYLANNNYNFHMCSVIPTLPGIMQSKEKACEYLNNAKISFTIHYNTDYIIVSYRGNNNCNVDYPLFSMLKGTIQDGNNTPIVWCCGNPNYINNEIYQSIVNKYGIIQDKPQISYHKMVVPSKKDLCFEYQDAYDINGKATVKIQSGNELPFWIDARYPNFWTKNLFEEKNNGDKLFRKQNITAFGGNVQFSENIIYGDQNCTFDTYYKIGDEKYWCPGDIEVNTFYNYVPFNSQFDYGIKVTKVMVKL